MWWSPTQMPDAPVVKFTSYFQFLAYQSLHNFNHIISLTIFRETVDPQILAVGSAFKIFIFYFQLTLDGVWISSILIIISWSSFSASLDIAACILSQFPHLFAGFIVLFLEHFKVYWSFHLEFSDVFKYFSDSPHAFYIFTRLIAFFRVDCLSRAPFVLQNFFTSVDILFFSHH